MIRKMEARDKECFIRLAEQFYSSDAVLHPIPREFHERTFRELMRSDVYIEAYIFEYSGKTAGYALTSKMFSQEAGGVVLWIDELFVLPGFQSKGLGSKFFAFITGKEDIVRFRLEADPDNEAAMRLYRRTGFDILPYVQMIMDR